MQFSITITGEDKELTPAVQALVAALAQGNNAVTVDKPEKSKASSGKGSKPTEAPPEKAEVEETEPDQADEAQEEIPSDVELRAKAQEIGTKDAANKPKIKALLTEFGVSNLTAVPDNRRIELMGRLNAL